LTAALSHRNAVTKPRISDQPLADAYIIHSSSESSDDGEQ